MDHFTEKQTYNDFLSGLSAGLLRELGREYEARAITNTKNNGVLRNGILIQKKEEAVAPAIYLDGFYEEYCSGRGLSDIIRQVLYTYQESAKEGLRHGFENIDLSPEHMKENLVFRIVNYQKNAEMLRGMPHIRFLDLAVFFQILVYRQKDGIGTIRFTEDYFREYAEKRQEEAVPKSPLHEMYQQAAAKSPLYELYQQAAANTVRLFPARLNVLEELMESFLNGKEAPFLPYMTEHAQPRHRLYVLSNSAGINGASCLLYPGLLEQLRNFFQSEFYILPSSIHEVILLPVEGSAKQEELNDMVREINLTQVPAEEVLSDRSYCSKEVLEALLALSNGVIPKCSMFD